MAKQEATTTINDDTLLALIASIQSLTLTLHANMPAMSADPGLATPPPTAPSASTTAGPPMSSAPEPASAAATAPATAPAIPPAPGPIPPPPTFGNLSPVYRTDLALSSRGVHPTVLEALPGIVSAPDAGPWFVVTVGRYTGIYREWHEVNPLVTGWSRACCKRHPTKDSALVAYDNAWIHGNVHGGIHPDHHL